MTRFKPAIYFILLTICALLIVPTGCSKKDSATQSDDKTNRDHLLGWYKLGNTMIPVFKIDKTYYSVCRAFEIPFKECPEGLEWDFTPSSMTGTKIGFDEQSNNFYIIIEDSMRESQSEETSESIRKLGFKLDEKTPITKIEKPSGLLDPTAKPPHTNEDFLGWYQPVWAPFIRWQVQKENNGYISTYQELSEPNGIWKTRGEPYKLNPLPDRLGFAGFDRKSKHRLIYNQALKRFELTGNKGEKIQLPLRMPLVYFSSENDKPAPKFIPIGIPSWH